MGRVNPDDYGGGERQPKLTPEVVGTDRAVLTVMEAHTGITTGDGRKAAFLSFREFPDHVLWLNKSGITRLVEQLGENDEDWLGQLVPLVKVRNPNPQTGGYVVKYEPAIKEEWDETLQESGRRRRRRTPQTKAPGDGRKKKKAGKAKK
ncbi:MAG: hypothetical protein V3T65_06945 [Acidobacteriota bacterium]